MNNLAIASVAVAVPGEPPTVYVTENVLSQTIAGAFAQGCGGNIVTLPRVTNRFDFVDSTKELIQRGYVVTDSMATYGILRGCGELIAMAQHMKHDYWHIDNGYVRQSDHMRHDGPRYDGFYRITKNGFQNTDEPEARPPDRWKATGDHKYSRIAHNWTKGENILVIPPSKFVAEYQRIDPETWLKQVEAEIRKRTDRPIQIKTMKGELELFLPKTHCLVTHESMAALHAVILGTPAIALGNHCIGDLSWTWGDLERPRYFDRGRVYKLCHWLAYNQFSLDEIRSGRAWEMLNE